MGPCPSRMRGRRRPGDPAGLRRRRHDPAGAAAVPLRDREEPVLELGGGACMGGGTANTPESGPSGKVPAPGEAAQGTGLNPDEGWRSRVLAEAIARAMEVQKSNPF